MAGVRCCSEGRPSIQEGTVSRDTYTFLELLGQGRFADTYRVRHRYMGIQAMKVIVTHVEPEELEHCFAEAFLLSKLLCPGIVRVYDANRLEDTHGGYPYITMEYASGGTLRELLSRAGFQSDVRFALQVCLQIAEALAYAHAMERPLVHRDVKPANILLETTGDGRATAKLADFGLASHTDLFTKTVAAGGTILYMSPESLRGFESPASDVYSLGLVLYEMLTGTLPYPKKAFSGLGALKEIEAALTSLQQSEHEAPSYFNPRVFPELDHLVAKALEYDEQQRFQDGAHIAHAIDSCIDKLPGSSHDRINV